MQEAFGIVIFVVVGLGALAAVVSLLGRNRAYEQIGRGGLSLDSEAPSGRDRGAGAGTGEREAEIRQMLTARNLRRAARGEQPMDVEIELAALERPQIDPALRAEIRELVMARNARRVARGRDALDVEAEIERRISQLAE